MLVREEKMKKAKVVSGSVSWFIVHGSRNRKEKKRKTNMFKEEMETVKEISPIHC